MNTKRTAAAVALVLVGVAALLAGSFLVAVPLGLVVLGALLIAAGLLVDVGRRP